MPIETSQQHFKELYDGEEPLNIKEYETDITVTVNDEEVEQNSKN